VSNQGKLEEHMKNLKRNGIITIIIGALATFTFLAYQISPSRFLMELPTHLGFYLWVSLPFVVLIIMTSRINRKGDAEASRFAIFITSILVSILSVLIYWALSRSFGGALLLIFVPIFMLLMIAFVYGLTKSMSKNFYE
jgi:predicted neutral ceramidase superfamily lipid hydrolase